MGKKQIWSSPVVEDLFLKHEKIIYPMIKWPGPPLKGGSVSTVIKGLFSILLFLPKALGHVLLTASQHTHTSCEPDTGRNNTNHKLIPLQSRDS